MKTIVEDYMSVCDSKTENHKSLHDEITGQIRPMRPTLDSRWLSPWFCFVCFHCNVVKSKTLGSPHSFPDGPPLRNSGHRSVYQVSMAIHEQTATSFGTVIMVEINEIHHFQDTQKWQGFACRPESMPRIGPGLRQDAFVMFSPKQIATCDQLIHATPCLDPQKRSSSSDKMPNPGMVDITQTNIVRHRRMTLERPKPYHGSATTIPDYCIVIFATINCSFCLFFRSAVLSYRLCFQGPAHVQPEWQPPWYSSSSSTTGPLIPLHHFAIHEAKHHRVVQVVTPMIWECKKLETSRSRTAHCPLFISGSFTAWRKYHPWIW